jgi:hypothetical protein
MIKWNIVFTAKRFAFYAYRTKKGYGNIILLKDIVDFYKSQASLTNRMEEVLEHIAGGAAFGGENLNDIKFYQWCDGEGLFEVIPWWVKKITRDMPPFKLDKIEWKFISKDVKQFEVLYCD